MQDPILKLVQLGPLPSSDLASDALLQKVEGLLSSVQKPIADDEAAALARLLGPDDCFGLGWTLVHLIETAPGWPIEAALEGLSGEWAELLRQRIPPSR